MEEGREEGFEREMGRARGRMSQREGKGEKERGGGLVRGL